MCDECGATNLVHGAPDHPCPPELHDAAVEALRAGTHQYAISCGDPTLRAAVADGLRRRDPEWRVDPETEVTVTCGSTEAILASLLAHVDNGDEVIVFEPSYDNYVHDILLCGATPRIVYLDPHDWSFDESALRRAFTPRTRAIIVNTPHNPTGKVFAQSELQLIGELCAKHDVVCVSDEVYEHLQYTPAATPLALMSNLEDRTVTVSSISKTYAATGWRVGWAVAPPASTANIRKVHDLLTVGAPAPMQAAAVVALNFPDDYYVTLAAEYRARRDMLCAALSAVGFRFREPDGASYVLCDTTSVDPHADAERYVRTLMRTAGVAGLPGTTFYTQQPERGRQLIRFSFAKQRSTIAKAIMQLRDCGDLATFERSLDLAAE